MQLNRRNFLSLGAAATTIPALGTSTQCSKPSTFPKEYFLNWGSMYLKMPWPGLKNKFKFRVIADTHFIYFDKRDEQYADNYARMGLNQKAKLPERLPAPSMYKLEDAIATAKKNKLDAIMLVGDILSFPSIANVEYAKKRFDDAGVPYFYIAGNHDWHFEGLPGSSDDLRKEWIEKRLKPLYPEGVNPLMYSKVVNGVRIVAIDNSTYLINEEQLEFWKTEAAKGDPIVLIMHIPLYIPGAPKGYCGSPHWGAAIDPYWRIERRQRWAEKATPETFAFRDAVLSTPNLAGVFTGHIHQAINMRGNGQNMFSVPSCGGHPKQRYLDVTMYGA